MKYTVTETKCEEYQIIAFQDASDETESYFDENVKKAPLKIDICYQYLDGNKTDYLARVLPEPFAAACRGESSDWKLVRVGIHEKELELGFMSTKGTEIREGVPMFRYAGHSIRLKNFVGTVSIEAKRQGANIPDRYDIEMHDKSDGATEEGQWIATIHERRYGKEYAYEILTRKHDGETYLKSFRYD